ncbi:MAG: hypothetical protein GDA48_22615 [Hormoscilla sp. GM102CHS1]|nr:hypothetical protein [Hormoscilla sp. GM102CHS1]
MKDIWRLYYRPSVHLGRSLSRGSSIPPPVYLDRGDRPCQDTQPIFYLKKLSSEGIKVHLASPAIVLSFIIVNCIATFIGGYAGFGGGIIAVILVYIYSLQHPNSYRQCFINFIYS